MKRICLLMMLGLLFIGPRLEAQNYIFTAIPEWVKTVNIPKESSISKYEIASGFYLTLGDYQVNLDNNTVFNHEVYNIVSYSGITNASQLAVSYDTSYQKLHIHHLIVWRKGHKQDRTKELSFEIMNTETQLHQGIYTGQITAYDILKDIRKDDLIDFAYSIEGSNPIFKDEKYHFIPLESASPMDLYSIRVLYLKDKDYSYRCVDCDSLQFAVGESDQYKEIEIINRNLKALDLEDYIPTWETPYKYFVMSSYKSWEDVDSWAQEVFALEKEPNLEVVFNEIFSGEENTDAKINKIINYVQDDIRYMGIESGIGSIKPFPPEQVVEQRFGDCKDKSLLLVSLLKNIGLHESYPVLVNTITKQETDKHFPSNKLFNHCIVMFKYEGETYWVDPTIAAQGGDFKDLFTPDYGKALIIGQPGDSLAKMSPRETKTGAHITEEMIVSSFSQPARLIITSNRFGFEADTRRAMFEYVSTNDLSEMVTEDLKKVFPIVTKTSDLIIEENIDSNHFIITYNYEVDGFWQDGDEGNGKAKGFWIYKFEPQSLYQYLKNTSCEERDFDFELRYPLNMTYRFILNFHKDLLVFDEFKIIEGEVFYFEEKIEQISSKSIQIDYVLNLKADRIKAADYKKTCDQFNSIAEELPLLIYFAK